MRDQTRLIIRTRYRDVGSTPNEVSAEIRRYIGKGFGKYVVAVIWVDAEGTVCIYK